MLWYKWWRSKTIVDSMHTHITNLFCVGLSGIPLNQEWPSSWESHCYLVCCYKWVSEWMNDSWMNGRYGEQGWGELCDTVQCYKKICPPCSVRVRKKIQISAGKLGYSLIIYSPVLPIYIAGCPPDCSDKFGIHKITYDPGGGSHARLENA